MNVSPGTYFQQKRWISDCLLHASKAHLLTSLPKSEIIESEIIFGKVDDHDANVLRIAANLEAWNIVPNSPPQHGLDNLQPRPQSLSWDRVLFVSKKDKLRQLGETASGHQAFNLWSRRPLTGGGGGSRPLASLQTS